MRNWAHLAQVAQQAHGGLDALLRLVVVRGGALRGRRRVCGRGKGSVCVNERERERGREGACVCERGGGGSR